MAQDDLDVRFMAAMRAEGLSDEQMDSLLDSWPGKPFLHFAVEAIQTYSIVASAEALKKAVQSDMS